MIVEKKITELEVGYYILDIVEQDGTYSLKKPGHIKNINVISHLASNGVLSVLVDKSKTLITSVDKDGNTTLEPASEKQSKNTTIKLELTKAKKIFKESKSIQRQLFSDVLNGKDINLTSVKEITNRATDAIFKNQDALACILNIRIKDEYLLEHSVSVSILMTIFAKHLGIERQIIEQLSIGAFLHDVGKIMIPNQILNKPSRLTEEEFVTMKTHTNHSIKILNNTPNISELSLEVAALHHEKLNGRGYPYGLKSKDISLYGRMIAVCDIFDALTADRCYKDGYPHIKAFNILRKLAQDGELDNELVDKFIHCMGVYPVGSLVELKSHRLAIVEERNSKEPIKPKVRAFYNVNTRHYTMTEDIDLAKTEDTIAKGARADEFDLDMNRIVEFLMMQG
ncbi:HD-GYP domain-containing protein [Thalassotalea atypica]|uniref:HD-GYP domain-containing protein n=1 Tax=Thalassotalea atypica TaxID=2054316 RepID=UPI002572718A|nr:HD-GYP domain-containing protein [Thalassotalea atypica]